MRILLSILALTTALAGMFATGAGVFSHAISSEQIVRHLAAPFLNAQPFPCFIMTISAALGFFSVALVASGGKSITTPLKASHVFLSGGMFSIITAAGLGILLYALLSEGATGREAGLVFGLASIQACLGMILGGSAMLVEKRILKFAVPVFVAGLLETSLSGAVLIYGTML